MEIVTEKDLNELIVKFEEYTETAQQYEIPILAYISKNILNTNIKNIVNNQKEARAMYRAISKVIHNDFSKYKER